MEPAKQGFRHTFTWPDYVVFSLTIIASVAIGIFFAVRGRHKKTTHEFLLASGKMKWIPVGVSLIVTFQSAILFIGIPAEIYTQGLSYLLFHIGMAFSVLLCAFIFVPLLFPLKVTSAYEYLELRFESRCARVIGSLLGMLNMILYLGVVIFAPSTAMEAVSGIPPWISILVVGAVATFYTTLGGLKAVIWTDVFQFVIMLTGLLAILIKGLSAEGGLSHVWSVSNAGGRIDFGGFDVDPRVRHTVWSLVIGGTLTWLANIGVNQANVQRFCSVPTLSAARWSVLTSLPGFVILGCLASLVGLIVYAYFNDIQCDPLAEGIVNNPNQLVPLYVTEVFYNAPGFSGLFVASLFSASLSTVSSSINSQAAMAWEDLVKWRFPDISEEKATLCVKCFVFVFGALAVTVAFVAKEMGGPATQIALSFFGASGGPLLGMFLLGAFFPWANWIGASSGALSGLALCLWIAIGSRSLPSHPGLPPSPVSGCPSHLVYNDTYSNGHSLNGVNLSTGLPGILSTTPDSLLAQATYSNPLEPFYRISYLWYSSIGILTVLVVGLTVSFITGASDPRKIDPQLIFPVFDKFCCCLPMKWKEKLHCGVLHHSERVSTQEPVEDDNTQGEKGESTENKMSRNSTLQTSLSSIVVTETNI